MKKQGKTIITIIHVLIMFSISVFLFAADDSIVELEKKLEAASGKEKIKVLNQLSAAYLNHSPEKSIDWGNKAWQLARELRHQKGKAAALKNIGRGNAALARYEKALEYFNHSLRIFETIKSDKVIGEEPIEPKQFRPEIPNELNDLILKMMSKKPGKRPGEEKLLKIIEITMEKNE